MAMTDAEKVENYRKMAQDKSLPPEVREKYDQRANEIEAKSVGKAGVKLAKGGLAKKAPMKAPTKKAPAKLAKGGMAKKKC